MRSGLQVLTILALAFLESPPTALGQAILTADGVTPAYTRIQGVWLRCPNLRIAAIRPSVRISRKHWIAISQSTSSCSIST